MTSRPAFSTQGRLVKQNRLVGTSTKKQSPGAIDWKPEHCTAVKKNGEACPARCVKGTLFCIGHTRSNAKQG